MPESSFIIQVAGVLDVDEARLLADCGSTHLGLPLGPGVRTPDTDADGARAIVRALSGTGVVPVLITYLRDPAEVAALAWSIGVDAVQLHGPTTPEQAAGLRALWPELFVIKSLVVGRRDEADLPAEMAALAPHVDAFLTDTFDPATGACGATGLAHDWAVSARLVKASPRPVILAGGLNPDNVALAVRAVRPAGVDAHTGLEDASGRKDPVKVRSFVSQARRTVASFPEAL